MPRPVQAPPAVGPSVVRDVALEEIAMQWDRFEGNQLFEFFKGEAFFKNIISYVVVKCLKSYGHFQVCGCVALG